MAAPVTLISGDLRGVLGGLAFENIAHDQTNLFGRFSQRDLNASRCCWLLNPMLTG
jgi:hypothetical protein